MRGTSALSTVIAGARSNSWTYTPERRVAKLAGGACPIYSSPIPYDIGRTLFVDEGDHLVQYRTESRDFHDSETRHYKRTLGQVFIDVSDKPAPDDFATDLRKLRLADSCVACDKREDCANTYVKVEEDLFTAADRRVREVIAGVIERLGPGARVVDVGCSDDGRYADLWEPAARAGRVKYLGIEPEAERARRLAERFPWAEVRPIPVEELVADESAVAGLEAVLVLRSWNHIGKPVEALGPLVAALKPGGLVLVVDNVAFGLCRTDLQRHRAETSTSIWEHFRNDDSRDAIATLAALPLDVVSEIPVVPEGANQWIVELRKR
jgi:SAM-dependent methyltransferase